MDFNGALLKDLRKKAKQTLQEVANAIDSSKSYVWELENKKHLKPSGYKVYLLCKHFGVDISRFYEKKSKHPYGLCPHCGAVGVQRERSPNGNTTCSNGHVYPSSEAIYE